MNLKKIDRRSLLKHGSLLAGTPFLPFLGDIGSAQQRGFGGFGRPRGGYGPLIERPRSLLHLPEGFRYFAFSPVGARMSDGNLAPGAHDGMRAFDLPVTAAWCGCCAITSSAASAPRRGQHRRATI